MSMLYSPVPVVSRSPFFRVNGASTTKINTTSKRSKINHANRFSGSTSPASPSTGSMLSCCDDDLADGVCSAEEEILSSLAREAMHRVLSAATSATFANSDWKECRRSVNEAVYEKRTAHEFSIIARAMVPCTIDEISSVLSSDDSDQLNASLIELLGRQFGYAVTMRTIPTPRSASLDSHLSVKFLSFGRRGCLASSPLSSSSFSKRGITIVDYIETDRELRTACRVMQPICRTENLATGDDPQSILGDAVCGYVLREDPATRHTVVFFFGMHAVRANTTGKLSSSTIQGLRKMTRVTSKWVDIARRRRLGAHRVSRNSSAQLLSASSSSVRMLSSCCFTCDHQFRPLVRRKHLCCLCGYFTCGGCSSAEAVEQRIGLVQRLRVCGACLANVTRKAFDSTN